MFRAYWGLATGSWSGVPARLIDVTPPNSGVVPGWWPAATSAPISRRSAAVNAVADESVRYPCAVEPVTEVSVTPAGAVGVAPGANDRSTDTRWLSLWLSP